MSRQKAILLEIADALSSGGDHRIEAWFTEDFRLHDPGVPDWPSGHRGASAMLAQNVSLGPTTKFEALDMLEEDNWVAVRWRLTGTREGKIFDRAIMSMYRFENDRIAEDWGISSQEGWPSSFKD
jgi:predicted SnoaL-like aldol condensation-catalyzing enzyme